MSLPGDENPNPQWQRSEPQWTSGSPLGEPEWQREPAPTWQAPPGSRYAGWVPPPRTPGQAVAALILGIVGLVLCPIVGSILALVFGYMGKREIDASGGRLGGRGIALSGIVLGWVGLAVWGLLVALAILGALVTAS
jgi:hypothetical protein